MEKSISDVLVIKIGTSTLVQKNTDGSEELDRGSLQRLGQQIRELRQQGTHVVIVSSAGIAAGMVATGLRERPSKTQAMPELQRLASIGWRVILNVWSDVLGGASVGGLLLTKHELDVAPERTEAVRTIHCLLSHGDVPIINENDAITHEEIAFGDNDMLAAQVASRLARSELCERVRLVILSDVDGVYRDIADPTSLIQEITNIDQFKQLAKDTSSKHGTGGMVTKLRAAEIATAHGVAMYISNGRLEHSITRALQRKTGTCFTVRSAR